MLDPRLFRTNLDEVAAQLARRGFHLAKPAFVELESRRKDIQVLTQNLQNQRNTRSKSIGQAKARGEDIQPLLDEIAHLGDDLKTNEQALESIQARLEALLLDIPNILDADVPDGAGEAGNIEVKRWGEPPVFDFVPKDHTELGEPLGMNFEAAAKLTGARFVVLQGPLARLQRALTQFMLDVHSGEHGYTETYVPFMVNADSMRGTGQLPKFEEDLFKVPRRGFELSGLNPNEEYQRLSPSNVKKKTLGISSPRPKCRSRIWCAMKSKKPCR
jgi:seryl-tRNA synthetase